MSFNLMVSRLLLRPYTRFPPNYARHFAADQAKLAANGPNLPQTNPRCDSDKQFQLCVRSQRYMGTSSVFQSKDEDSSGDSLTHRILNKLFPPSSKYKLRPKGFFLLTQCAQEVDVKTFFTVFDMPDTFYSWFIVTELHVWMLSVRLMEEGPLGRALRNFIVEALWQDCDARAKLVGDMSGSSRSKQINNMAEEFQAALFIYDEGLLGSDMDLANALWRRFFLSQREEEEQEQFMPDPEKIEMLVQYVRKTIKYLEDYDGDTMFRKCEVEWLSLQSV